MENCPLAFLPLWVCCQRHTQAGWGGEEANQRGLSFDEWMKNAVLHRSDGACLDAYELFGPYSRLYQA